jgi:5-methylcytosine-specific restriction enzyme subunit McrC
VTETKIPIENIYYLLCYAWKQLDEASRIHVNASDYNQYIDLFAKVLNNGCNYLFKRVLDREYCIERESISGIKGKIDFGLSLNSLMQNSPKMFCEYDELSNDILHNQIIKAVIRKVLNVKSLDKNIHSDLMDIYCKMHYISDLAVNRNHFKKVRLHRNNLFYRFVLNVAYIISESIVLDETSGNYEFVDFVRDERKMSGIFESFVRNFYKEQLTAKGFQVKPEIIKWDAQADDISLGFLPVMKTDISITSSTRKIIIDTKYYSECFQEYYDKKTIISKHLYQLMAYLENHDTQEKSETKSEGMLLYPTVKHEVSLPYTLMGHKIYINTINLNQSWRGISNDLVKFIS